MNLLQLLRQRLRDALVTLTPEPENFVDMLRPAGDTRFGDFQANCAMPMQKSIGKPAREIAEQIVQGLKIDDICEPATVAGPGFINLKLKESWLEQAATECAHDVQLGLEPASPSRRYIVDFSSPNVAKPMHVGHLRSTVIGHALYKVLKKLGHSVQSDNHIGDWGTQFGMIIFGYKNFRHEGAFEIAPVAELARLYRLVNQLSDYHALKSTFSEIEARVPTATKSLAEAQELLTNAAKSGVKKSPELQQQVKKAEAELREATEALESATKKISAVESEPELLKIAAKHPRIAENARLETAKLHAGDPENLALWNQFLPDCLKALEGLYARFDLKFDMTLGESWYNPMLPGMLERLEKAKLLTTSQGAQCVFIEGYEAPFIVRKSDGAFTYATTDLATIEYRVDSLQADAILYVVDSRQSEHFDMLFATARKLGYDNVELTHVKFGTILGEDKRPFKTRSGDTVGLESLLDEAVVRARQIVNAGDDGKPTGAELDDTTRQAIAEIVGIGGIIYADLHHSRESDYTFSFEKMLATRGDTATYMQYAYARTHGIFRKGGIDIEQLRKGKHPIRLTQPCERMLALQLVRFGEALHDVAAEYRPNVLTQYLFETANRFSTFFDECPVLKETDESIRNSRLLLCDWTARVMKEGLDLLGIRVAEKM
ncbi:Arginine--tRNA ligase [Planctopirus ephydatiae]|uniref:Arginine--tRNA ligase n=1 Tax=Planctopirus ephydatiae TaxID=2528019 RepID=A0A518GN72_9PLAN|nr:arginine--tRNA ligase [Planctopirus ephydatiae]QDV30068.1 Arginine--tRNA ligase [Planctopirus ephydatiae]